MGTRTTNTTHSTRTRNTIAASLAAALITLPMLSGAGTSRLWGRAGEQWEPHGRLPDFSYAGYHAGRRDIPNPPVVVNVVRDCGARGNGDADDTAAFRCAFDRARDGAISVPPGRYRLRDQLSFDRSNVVLRGAGREDTTLIFTRSLAEAAGFNAQDDDPSLSKWSFEGGMITSSGGRHHGHTAVVARASRGDTWLRLRSSDGIHRGDTVILRMEDHGGSHSLSRELYGGQATGRAPGEAYFPVRIAQVDGDRVQLDQPLRFDVDTDWNPHLDVYDAISEIGIENLTIQFPRTPYRGHHQERGYNAIGFPRPLVFDAWISNVAIENADNGILVDDAARVTVRNVVLRGDRPGHAAYYAWEYAQGHHGITAGTSTLVENVTVNMNFVHELTVVEGTSGNAFVDIDGDHGLSLDHHGGAPMENLFSRIHRGVDWHCGGGARWPESGARGTFWNFDNTIDPPPWAEIQTNVIGQIAGNDERHTDHAQWFEDIGNLEPGNLYAAQLQRRLAIEDQDTAFADGPFGRRRHWHENRDDRWATIRDNGDYRYWLASTVFEQRDGDRLGELSIADSDRFEHASIRARARSFEDLAQNEHADFALVLGHRDDRNYCYALYSHADGESGIFAVTNGRAQRVARAAGRLVRDEWSRVEFRRTADAVEMLQDGAVVAHANASTCTGGHVGLGSLDDSAYFDDVAIESDDAGGSMPMALVADGLREVPVGGLDPDHTVLDLDPSDRGEADDGIARFDGDSSDPNDDVDPNTTAPTPVDAPIAATRGVSCAVSQGTAGANADVTALGAMIAALAVSLTIVARRSRR